MNANKEKKKKKKKKKARQEKMGQTKKGWQLIKGEEHPLS